jgi:hypothetical protein
LRLAYGERRVGKVLGEFGDRKSEVRAEFDKYPRDPTISRSRVSSAGSSASCPLCSWAVSTNEA